MKQTILAPWHQSQKTQWTAFGEWKMPLHYGSIIEEHLQTRQASSIFDTCHMGEIEIRGSEALKFIQEVFPRDLSHCQEGRCYYTHLLNNEGGILDDCILYCYHPERFMLVTNSATHAADWEWLQSLLAQAQELEKLNDCHLQDLTANIGKIDLQGPNSSEILLNCFDHAPELQHLKYFHFLELNHNGHPVTISRTGYTGELGFELYCPLQTTSSLWAQLLHLGAQAAGLGARDTLRLEMGYPLMGQDLSSAVTPLEAGCEHLVTSKADFVGSQALANRPKQQHLLGFEILTTGVARTGSNIFYQDQKIGRVSSGNFSPSLKRAIGLAWLDKYLEVGSSIEIEVRRQRVQAQMSAPPFWSQSSLRSGIHLPAASTQDDF